MQQTLVHNDTGSPVRRTRRRVGWVVTLAALTLAAACGDDDDGEAADGAEDSTEQTAELVTAVSDKTVTEDKLPAGFEAAPTVTIDGQEMTFDMIPGHYWKVLDNGAAIGLHFQSEKPFRWAEDAGDNELLYLVYAAPGRCPGLNFQAGVAAPDATPSGKLLPGFDHWHGLVGDQSAGERGHWLMHIPVRDQVFGGMPGNPFEGKEIAAGTPWFMPVCEPAMSENPDMMDQG